MLIDRGAGGLGRNLAPVKSPIPANLRASDWESLRLAPGPARRRAGPLAPGHRDKDSSVQVRWHWPGSLSGQTRRLPVLAPGPARAR